MKRCPVITTLFFLTTVHTYALIFYSTGDVAYNTNVPSGSLTNSGWQWQGEWNKGSTSEAQYLGTPIASHYFITAKHIGAAVSGWVFRYLGETYTPVASYTNNDGSDLQIWKVDKSFPSYAPLYTSSDENGKGCVVFGRGKTRGDTVITGSSTNGWEWGPLDNIMRWGTNKIASAGGGLLTSEFDGGGSNECAMADKDSGGAVFIKDSAGIWRLAGINYYISPAQFSTNSDGSNSFYAACFDYRGLYYYTGTSWQYAAGGPAKKQQLVATQISSRYSWITNIIGSELDQDVDLLPDWWEKAYTNSATNLSASADSDGDGFSNLQEYLADTNPTNPASFFEMSGFLAEAGQTVYFSGSTARQYQVFCTTNNLADTNPVWVAAHTNLIWGTGTNSSITITNAGSKAFYRLKAILP